MTATCVESDGRQTYASPSGWVGDYKILCSHPDNLNTSFHQQSKAPECNLELVPSTLEKSPSFQQLYITFNMHFNKISLFFLPLLSLASPLNERGAPVGLTLPSLTYLFDVNLNIGKVLKPVPLSLGGTQLSMF